MSAFAREEVDQGCCFLAFSPTPPSLLIDGSRRRERRSFLSMQSSKFGESDRRFLKRGKNEGQRGANSNKRFPRVTNGGSSKSTKEVQAVEICGRISYERAEEMERRGTHKTPTRTRRARKRGRARREEREERKFPL